jgi:riboflavin synthase alpha subunit
LYVLFPVKTGIGENLAVGASMVYNGSVLTVTNMNGSTLTVYAADGTTVCRQRVSGNEFAIDLPLAHGTYIARCGTLVYKFKK